MDTKDLTPREKMAAIILSFEARRDKNGHLAVYKLPSGDGGGTYEVGGINDRYDPKEAPHLRDLVNAGKYDEAEKYARDYILKNTNPVLPWFKDADGSDLAPSYPGVEFFLRDTVFNRGASGCAKIMQRALGVTVDGAVGPQTKVKLKEVITQDWKKFIASLRAARELYERNVVRRNERSKFWKGLVNRWNNVTAKALSFA